MSGTAEVKELPVTTRLTEAEVRELEALAKKADRSRAAEVRRAVRAYLDAAKEAA